MNIATVFGFIAGLGVLAWAVFASTESVGVFLNLPGIAIVLGGTVAATFICYPLKEVVRITSVFLMALSREELPTGTYIHECVAIAEKVSKRGEAALAAELPRTDNEFLKNGLQMVLDGYSAEEIAEILDNRIRQYHAQETGAAGVFRTMSTLSPAFGIIGTLIGLIAMMQSMTGDLTQLGPAMAVALTTTLYGTLLANLVFLPVAIKVENRVDEIATLMSVIRDGILHIKERTPPAIVLDKLKGYLPPRRWHSIGGR